MDDMVLEYRSQPPKIKDQEWFASNIDAATRSARMSLAATGKAQVVHAHGPDGSCRDRTNRGECFRLRPAGSVQA